MIGALGMVLGMLAGGLWLTRRYEIRLPQQLLTGFGGFSGSAAPRRLQLVERLTIDPRRSVALIRRDDREHLVMISPEGLLILESAVPAAAPIAAPVASPAVISSAASSGEKADA
jgi:flagellar protein FliO/FliZ